MLDKKVMEMENQLEVLNSLPSNQDLIEKAKLVPLTFDFI